MEKNPNEQRGKMYDDTENLFKNLAAGLDENRREKVKEYVKRIKNGEDKDFVLQNQDKNSVFYRAVEEALLETENKKIDNKEEEIKDKKVIIEKDETQKITTELKTSLLDADKKKENEEINIQLKSIGLNIDDLKNNKEWQNFSKAEKLLIIEQASQDTLAHVKEIGEKRFQEKNAIKLSWNPLNLRPSFFNKIYNKLGKSYWISKEEKEVINEVEKGEIKPNSQILDSLIKRQSDLGLNVSEKNGKAFIEFAKSDKNLSTEEKNIIDRYNEEANAFAKMPDSWKNEKSAKSTDKMFEKENHQKYQEVKDRYESEKNKLIESKAKQYEKSGLSKGEARDKSMMDVKDMDFKLSMLQFTNTNPDALDELNKIKDESSWGRLVNNENIWRSIYMSAGYGARGATHATLGFFAAPLVSGVVGGIRARRKANENINKAFSEGTKEETFLERKENGKSGIFENKNLNQGIVSSIFSGKKVNTKEVAAFVDADSQKQRINNLINKINSTENGKEKTLLLSQLLARIEYIELKQQQGLINYGNKNPIGKNYELFKSLSEAYVVSASISNLGLEMTKGMKDDILERETLIKSVMAKNEAAFGKGIAQYKNEEMLRGAAVAGGFAILGGLIRGIIQHDDIPNGVHSNNEISADRQHQINEALIKGHDTPLVKHLNIEAIADHGQGAISTLRELQRNLRAEYGTNLESAPTSVKHILNTDPHKLAQEYGMYKPGSDAESAFIKSGSSFKVDGNGNVTYHEVGGHNDIVLEKGNEIKVNTAYEGRMADTDHSGLKTETNNIGESSELYKVPPQVSPLTGELAGTQTEVTNLIDNPYKVPTQVSPLIDDSVGQQNTTTNAIDNQYKVPTQISPLVDEEKVINSPVKNLESSSLGTDFAREIKINSEENLKHIFPTEKLMETYDYIKSNVSAEKLIALSRGEGVADAYKPLVAYIDKLKDVSGFKPIGKSLINEAESISDYILRASKKAAEMGRLDEIKF